jgi:hypothetical protein
MYRHSLSIRSFSSSSSSSLSSLRSSVLSRERYYRSLTSAVSRSKRLGGSVLMSGSLAVSEIIAFVMAGGLFSFVCWSAITDRTERDKGKKLPQTEIIKQKIKSAIQSSKENLAAKFGEQNKEKKN